MEGKFTWGKHLFAKYDSLWSILHKFAAVNNLDHLDIYRILGDAAANVSPPRAEWSLDNFHRISRDRLSKVLNIDFSELRYATLEQYSINLGVFTSHFWQYVSNNLRYCPQCIQFGFHTPLFQYKYVRCCPIHNLPLTEKCVYCQFENKYQLGKREFKAPFCCSSCQKSYWKDDTGIYLQPPIAMQMTSIDSFLVWKAGLKESLRRENLANDSFTLMDYNYPVKNYDQGLLLTSVCSFRNLSESIWFKRQDLDWPEGALCIADQFDDCTIFYADDNCGMNQGVTNSAQAICRDSIERVRNKVKERFGLGDDDVDDGGNNAIFCVERVSYDIWDLLMHRIGPFRLWKIKDIDTFGIACARIERDIPHLREQMINSKWITMDRSEVDRIVKWVYQSLYEEFLTSSFDLVVYAVTDDSNPERFVRISDSSIMFVVSAQMQEVFDSARYVGWDLSVLNIDPHSKKISLTILG